MISPKEPVGPLGPSNPRSSDRLSEYAGFLADVSTIIAELEVRQLTVQPEHDQDQTEHSFSFEIIGENQIVIPEAVRSAMSEIDQITVTISKKSIDDSSTLSINFLSDTQTVFLSRSGDTTGADAAETDMLLDTSFKPRPGTSLLQNTRQQLNREVAKDFQDRFTAIEKVSDAELNTLIMSLIYPDAERGYEMFADANFLDPAAYESLKESFQLAALNDSSSHSYDFNTSASRFSYFIQQGQPTSFTFRYTEDGQDGRPVTVQNDIDTDFRLIFTTPYELSRTKGMTTVEKMPYYPTAGELTYLRSVLQREMSALKPTAVEVTKDERIDYTDPEATFIQGGGQIISKKRVREVLEQLGFDPPDASA